MNIEIITVILLVLSVIMLGIILVLTYLISSGLAGVIKSQEALNASMKTLSEQMSDVEEKQSDMHKDVRKSAQHFVNLAKSIKTGQNQPWWTGM